MSVIHSWVGSTPESREDPDGRSVVLRLYTGDKELSVLWTPDDARAMARLLIERATAEEAR